MLIKPYCLGVLLIDINLSHSKVSYDIANKLFANTFSSTTIIDEQHFHIAFSDSYKTNQYAIFGKRSL